MLSTLLAPPPQDPTLTVDNVTHIMKKVEPKERQRVLRKVIAINYVFDEIQSSENYSTALEVEAAAVDFYVNCWSWTSWEELARSLYCCDQVAAVEEVRSYLPPRGEPAFEIHVCTEY